MSEDNTANTNIEETEKTVKATPKKAKKEVNPQHDFLNNFNWHQYQEGIDELDIKQIKEFEKLVEKNFVDTSDDNIIEGEVIHLTDKDIIIDINAKSEGVISKNEFRYNPDLKVGDKVEVIVDTREDKSGQLVLSHRKARVIKAWDRVNEAHDKGDIVQGFVKCRTKGGMIVDVFGIEAFLPGSQIDVKPIRDYDQYDFSEQYLASKGAAVLKVNYRGSGGYGKDFMEDAYKEWGGTLLNDIADATIAVQKELGIGRSKTCAFGASYGGYAALGMAYKHSELYECVAGGMGVYDMQILRDGSDESLSLIHI